MNSDIDILSPPQRAFTAPALIMRQSLESSAWAIVIGSRSCIINDHMILSSTFLSILFMAATV